jgi:hypothetical protein
LPQTGHASAFKVISAPQHAQKAATSFSLHSCHVSFDECGKFKDSDGAAGAKAATLAVRFVEGLATLSLSAHQEKGKLVPEDCIL